MSENKILYQACAFAIKRKIVQGNSSYVYRDENGKWQAVDWEDVLEKIKVLERACEYCDANMRENEVE